MVPILQSARLRRAMSINKAARRARGEIREPDHNSDRDQDTLAGAMKLSEAAAPDKISC